MRVISFLSGIVAFVFCILLQMELAFAVIAAFVVTETVLFAARIARGPQLSIARHA